MDRGGVRMGRPLEHQGHTGDSISHNAKDFLRPNDAHGKSLTTSAANALQKMFNFNENDVHIRADGQGKIVIQLKDANVDSVGNNQVYDVKQMQPAIAKDFAYHIKRHIVSVYTGFQVEDLNNLKEVNRIYHSKDRDGNHFKIEPNDTERKAIDEDISSLGVDNNKQHIPDSIGKGILEHAADQETKNEVDPVKKQDLKDKINNGTVHSYEYDKKTDQYKFYIIQEGKDYVNGTGKADGDMREVSIDRESLPTQVEKGLEYHKTEQAIKKAYGLEDKYIRIYNGKIYIDTNDGETTYIFKDDPSLMKNIKDHLANKGLDYNEQWISDSVRGAAIKHAIDQETDPAKKAALKNGLTS